VEERGGMWGILLTFEAILDI
jgi:hypothetical protein